MKLSALLLGMVLQAPVASPAPRALAFDGPALPGHSKILEDAVPQSGDLKAADMVKISEDGIDLYVARDLWSPPSIALSQAFLEALEKADMSRPMTIQDLPDSCRDSVLESLNRRMQRQVEGRTVPFDVTTPLRLESEVQFRVRFGEEIEHVIARESASGKANGTASGPPPAQRVGKEDTQPPRVARFKQNLTIRLDQPYGDDEHWRLVTKVNRILDRHRQEQRRALLETSTRIRDRFFPGHRGIDPGQLKGEALNLPTSLKDELNNYRKLSHPLQEPDIRGGEVMGASSALLIVFRLGEKGAYAASLPMLFEGP